VTTTLPVLDALSAATLSRHLRDTPMTPAARSVRRGRVRTFGEFIAPKRLLDATLDDLDEWIEQLRLEGLAGDSLTTYRAQVLAFYRWADRNGLLTAASSSLVASVRVRRSAKFVIDPAGQSVLDEHLRELRRRGVRPASLVARDGAVRRFAATIAPTPLLDADRHDVERYLDGLVDRGLGGWTRTSYTANLRAFYQWAHLRGHVADDPAAEVVLPRRPQGVPRPIGEDDLRAAVTAAGGALLVWLLLAALCGLRAGEIALLRRENVLDDIEPPRLHVADGKGGRQRTVPLPGVVLAALVPYLQVKGRLWLADDPKPANTVSVLVGEHLHRLGQPYTAHNLRHRFATRAYQLSRDLRMVQDLLGHASPATTAVYAQFDHDRSTEVAGTMSAEAAAWLVDA